jgi:leader peptidase (prepilin peptidase) / N-methyltransferase
VTVLIVVIAFLLGAAIGSFLNVAISRLPKGESVVHPGSHCPECGAPVAPRDNIPIVSWLLLRGRCRSCGWRIPVRYLLVELATGLMFAAVALIVLV